MELLTNNLRIAESFSPLNNQLDDNERSEPRLVISGSSEVEIRSSRTTLNELDNDDVSEQEQLRSTPGQCMCEMPAQLETIPLKVEQVKKVTCIGAGFVGGPTSAVIAFRSNIEVTVVDVDAERIAAWNSDSLPFFEPGLFEIVAARRDSGSPPQVLHDSLDNAGEAELIAANRIIRRPNLFFSTNISQAIEDADLIFICVNTPMKAKGGRKEGTTNLDSIEEVVQTIARVAKNDKIVVEKSTVPCRTANTIREILSEKAQPGAHFEVLSNPEFLAAGTAIQDLLYPDRVVIGSMSNPNGIKAVRMLREVYSWVPTERIITMDLWSAELSKLAANALLAQRISSVSALSALCEATGADVEEVSRACGLDSRIGHSMLKAGPGFGGSCFQKDVLNLVYLAESLQLHEVAEYWQVIVSMNEFQKHRFASRIISCLHHNLSGNKIAILGFAFKKNTSDTRESPAIMLTNNLVCEGAHIAIYDPQVKERQIWEELSRDKAHQDLVKAQVEVCKSAYQACASSSAIVVMTDWDEFSNRSADNMETTVPHIVSAGMKSSSQQLQRLQQSLTGTRNHWHLPDSLPETFQGSMSSMKHTLVRLNWGRIASGMRRPRYIFDAHNMLDAGKLAALGCQVETIGRAGAKERQSSK